MKRKMMMVVFIFIVTGVFFSMALAQTPEESMKKTFPNIKYDSIQPSNIKGLYEVIVGGEILYFSPEAESIIAGEIITKDGRYITREKQQELQTKAISAKMKDIPLDKAVTIGKGKHVIIEVTDPDCPFCRKASGFLLKQTDVTRHVFFYPLPMHPQAKDKALYILCAKDKAKAYEEAMTGKLDDMTFKSCNDDVQAQEILKAHNELAEKLEIRGTPFFFVDGKHAIFGADIPQLEQLLKNE